MACGAKDLSVLVTVAGEGGEAGRGASACRLYRNNLPLCRLLFGLLLMKTMP